MTSQTKTRHRTILITALAGSLALFLGVALNGCSAASNETGNRSAPSSDTSVQRDMYVGDGGSSGDGSHQVAFQLINNSGYKFNQVSTGGKITGTSSNTLSSTPTTVYLTDDSSPTDQGYIQYWIQDSAGNAVGEADVTVTDNWYHGDSISVEYSDLKAGLISDSGANTAGSTTLTFFNGTCGRSYSHGTFSIDQTIYNSSPYTLTLLNDANFTNSNGGTWNTKPPATIAPGACAEVNGYTNDPVAGFELNATYTFNTPAGTQYAVFSNAVTITTPDGGGFSTESAVYSGRPAHTGGGWVGTTSTLYRMTDTGHTGGDDHPHTDTTMIPY